MPSGILVTANSEHGFRRSTKLPQGAADKHLDTPVVTDAAGMRDKGHPHPPPDRYVGKCALVSAHVAAWSSMGGDRDAGPRERPRFERPTNHEHV